MLRHLKAVTRMIHLELHLVNLGLSRCYLLMNLSELINDVQSDA